MEKQKRGRTGRRWKILGDANSYCFDGRVMEGRECIAFVDLDDPRRFLIAAAPDLYEAARRARDELDFVKDGSTGGIPNAIATLIYEVLNDLDAALLKANPSRKGEA